MKVGPILPQRLKNPCVVEVTDFKAIFVMGPKYQNYINYYLYHPGNGTWTDLSNHTRCTNDKSDIVGYSCSILHSNVIVISILSEEGRICSDFYDFKISSWFKFDGEIDVDQISDAKLLRSKSKVFVTLLASSQITNTTHIYQVSVPTKSDAIWSSQSFLVVKMRWKIIQAN